MLALSIDSTWIDHPSSILPILGSDLTTVCPIQTTCKATSLCIGATAGAVASVRSCSVRSYARFLYPAKDDLRSRVRLIERESH